MEVLAASVSAIRRQDEDISVVLRLRNGVLLERAYDAVVVTTGPAHGGILNSRQPWLKEAARPRPPAAGPDRPRHRLQQVSEALDGDSRPDPTLLISGPLARGTFSER